ncbi:hypothetical protein DL96DRAFT_1592690 [Flagelloscypha sp. PMI_526]|nr:hypothetical protein DL96DRAFT_1592690 [Flagelloscypha sp. PMI_526]
MSILKTLLQLHLASDAQAIIHAPYILSCINPAVLEPSSHLPKWLARINALIRSSKDPAAVWAGLTFALQTALCSKSIMIESSSGWLTAAMSILLRNEPLPTLCAAIRLIRTIFSRAMDVNEFQRQVCLPNVPKFSEALVNLVQSTTVTDLRIYCFDTLTMMISLHPSLHRQLQPSIAQASLRFLDRNSPDPINHRILHAASKTYSVLPVTGGKVAAANLWRKSVQDTLQSASQAIRSLRLTFEEGDCPPTDPLLDIPLNLDRLQSSIVVLQDLLTSTVKRPFQAPLGQLCHLASSILACTNDTESKGQSFDKTRRELEISALPALLEQGCVLVKTLYVSFKTTITPYSTRLLNYIVFQLDVATSQKLRAALIQTARILLENSLSLFAEIPLNRFLRVIFPTIANILPNSQQADREEPTLTSKKGKKRVRGYEGEEILRRGQEYTHRNYEERQVAIEALKVLPILLLNPSVSAPLQSLASRLVISLSLTLPQISSASLSPDPKFHSTLINLVHISSKQISHGTSGTLSKTLPLIIRQLDRVDDKDVFQSDFDILIHPRLPPLLRALPHFESLALWKAEESAAEAETHRNLLDNERERDIPLTLPIPGEDIEMQEPAVNESIGPSPEPRSTPTPALAPITEASSIPPMMEPVSSSLSIPPRQVPSPMAALASPLYKPAIMAEVFVGEEEAGDSELPNIDVDSDSDEDSPGV